MHNKKPKNILLLWDRMGDYHFARARALQKQYGKDKVFTADLGAQDTLYKWGEGLESAQNHFQLSDKPVEKKDVFARLRKFTRLLKEKNIGIVCIPGYGKMEYILFLLLCKLLGKKIILFAESWYPGNKLLDFGKSLFLKITCHSFFVSGIWAQNHFTNNLKINKKNLFTPYSVVDNAHFKNPDKKKNTPKTILCVARLAPEKNLEFLINSFLVSAIKETYKLIIVGDGELKEHLIALAKPCPNIILLPWASYNDLPRFYHNAGWFVLPSIFEPWGLVVNEAMAAGLPVIVSSRCGCLPDLVNAENGFTFNPNNLEELAEIFNTIDTIPLSDYCKMSESAEKKIKNFSPLEWANITIQMIIS